MKQMIGRSILAGLWVTGFLSVILFPASHVTFDSYVPVVLFRLLTAFV
jgi:hypothetical protein